MTRTIAWVAGRFDQVGGGERLIQEGLNYYSGQGHRTLVFTWSYDDVVNFDGEYAPPEVNLISPNGEGKSASRALARLRDLPRLRRLLLKNNVDVVLVQSEYDVALIYLATRFTRISYRFVIFGQNFQFPNDYGKYTLLFRRHLKAIVNSCAGYSQTVSITPPKIGLVDRVAMEAISVIRLFAVRSADKLFAFSNQVAWETRLLFGRTPTIARGAFRRSELAAGPLDTDQALTHYGLKNRNYLLSICRLVGKKRVNLIIEAFALAQMDDFILVVGGDGPERRALEDLTRKLGVADRVRFIGRVPNDMLRPMKQAASLFVSMDIGDYDLSPLEALLLRTPIILPNEFDAEGPLRNTPGVVVCDAEAAVVSRHMRQLVKGRAQPSPDLLERYTWEQYFSVLIQ